MSRVCTLLLTVLLSANVWSHQDPVRDKLTHTADLTRQQTDELMALYAQLYIKVHTLRHRQKGHTTTQHRLLLQAAYREHRDASLEYLDPNQYRKWMTVARRGLPRIVNTTPSTYSPQPSSGPSLGHHPSAYANSGLRYE